MDRAVLICTLVLIAVIVISTVVLHFGIMTPEHKRLPHAFLRTISIMATASGMHEEELEDSPGLKVFVSVLRILGAVLMAAFTAIVTQYLIRARLGGAFELRRVPEGGHHIVCGLDSVGFRVVQELVGYGERVVAIEWDGANHFIPTCRRLGAAVIVGDAAVNEVLRQAHAATAHSVIAATNNDLTNLAIALQVREMNPHHRVVLLLADPQFAQMMREAASVQLAASVPALAAPAFLAGLFGDRVQAIFKIGERLFAVLDLVIQPKDPLADQSMRAVAVDNRMLPVAVVPAQGPAAARPSMAARLSAGDRVIALVALADLEPLLRRQPATVAYAVDVTGCPLPTRPWLAGLVRTLLGCTQEEADKALANLPLRVGMNLTRGQAEDLMARLIRERVGARIVNLERAAAHEP
jgi:Trk K+ transport system NAD-binding subunit